MMTTDSGKLTLAHAIATNFFGGPEKQIIEHLKRLDAGRFRGIVISFLEGGRENEILSQAKRCGIDHFGIKMSSPVDFTALFSLKRLVIREKVGLLCTHGYKSTVMGLALEKMVKIPVLGFSRGYTGENRKVAFYEALDRFALRHISGVLCVSEGQRKKLATLGVRNPRTWVVLNAVTVPDPEASRDCSRSGVYRRFGIPEEAKLVVSAGRLSPEKGHRDLIQAIAVLGEVARECRFIVCGEGPCRTQLEQQSRNLGLDDRVKFVGFRKDVSEIFQAMDLMVLPSHSEGLPNVILEAFAFGKPVVATSVGGVPEIVEDGFNGLIVLPGQPELLAEAIRKAILSPAGMRTMGQNGLKTVQARFSFEEQNKILQEIYGQILYVEK